MLKLKIANLSSKKVRTLICVLEVCLTLEHKVLSSGMKYCSGNVKLHKQYRQCRWGREIATYLLVRLCIRFWPVTSDSLFCRGLHIDLV